MPINFRGLGGVNFIQNFLGPDPYSSVKAHGAAGTGVGDDGPSIQAAGDFVPSTGGLLYLEQGTYPSASQRSWTGKTGKSLRGAGMWATTIKATAAMSNLMQWVGTPRGNYTFEDLAFDLNGLANAAHQWYADDLQIRYRRCRFFNGSLAAAVLLSGGYDIEFEECLFYELGIPHGAAITSSQGSREIKLSRCQIRYLNQGLIISAPGDTTSPADLITVEDSYFDLGWYTLVEQSSGSGGTVSYSATVLTDTAATFPALGVNNYNIRVMPVLRTGTASFFYTRVTDASATFIADGVKEGHILRSGTTFAIIRAVESNTVLWVEEWLSNATRVRVLPPADGAYTVYGVYIGLVVANTATTLTTGRFHDLDGASVTPSAGTRYELLNHRPDYPLHCEFGAHRINVINNTFRRGWSDQISLYGGKVSVEGNLVEWGQDFGMTIHGQENKVTGNTVRRQGTVGIGILGQPNAGGYPVGKGVVVSHNVVTETPWVNNSDTYLGAITAGGTAPQIHDNVALYGGLPNERYGIVVAGLAGVQVTDGASVTDNVARGYAGGIRLYSDTVGQLINTRLRDNDGTISANDWTKITGTDFGVLAGAGSPEGVVTAAIGTIYRRSDGGAGTSEYVKESGIGNTGWVGK